MKSIVSASAILLEHQVEENDAGFDDENDEADARETENDDLEDFNGAAMPLRDGDVDSDREGGEDEHLEHELPEAGFAPDEDDEDFGDNIDEARANEPESDEEDMLEDLHEAMNEERAPIPKRASGDRISSRDGALTITRGPYVSQADAYSALKDLSLHDGHSVKHALRGKCSREVFIECTARCGFRGQLFRCNNNAQWWIAKNFTNHSGTCTSLPKVSVEMAASNPVVARLIKNAKRIRCKVVVQTVLAEFGAQMPVRTASDVIKAVRCQSEADFIRGFQMLESFGDSFVRDNPGSFFNVDYTPNGEFKSLSLVHGGMASIAVQAGLKMFSTDVTHMKGRYKGACAQTVALIDASSDGKSLCNLPIAVTFGEQETAEFIRKHFDALAGTWVVPPHGHHVNVKETMWEHTSVLFTDGGAAFQSFFYDDEHYYGRPKPSNLLRCAWHIFCNTRDECRRKKETQLSDVQFWAIATARTHDDYVSRLDKLRESHPHAAAFLANKDPNDWTVHGFIARGAMTFGRKTSNPVEQTHSAQLPSRDLGPFLFLVEYVTAMAQRLDDWRKTAQQLQRDQRERPFTPHAQKCIDHLRTQALRLDAAIAVDRIDPNGADPEEFTVIERTESGRCDTFRINHRERTCTCRGRAHLGYLCVHEYKVWMEVQRMHGDGEYHGAVPWPNFVEFAALPEFQAQTLIDALTRPEHSVRPPASDELVSNVNRGPPPADAVSMRAKRVRARIPNGPRRGR